MSLINIFQKPMEFKGIGKVYPIQLKDWDEFEEYLQILMLNNSHFEGESDDSLLVKLVRMGLENPAIIVALENIFNLITRTSTFQFNWNLDVLLFVNEEKQFVDELMYEELRKVVLHQNLLIEPKVFKSKRMQEWANDALRLKQKNSANVTLEDMVTTVSNLKGISYEKLETSTIYQLKSDFYRWQYIKRYDAISNLYGNPYAASELELPQFAECLELYADPYKDLFKSKNKMNITQALK
ncbi:hypothetical protein P4571_07735 [Niallia alba]|uniref:hypothetical protein n=1 Tax=Niallia alba TaxID=2729105 RepID=UPI002E243F53|nr:hypothetical protein [Niallia alba]